MASTPTTALANVDEGERFNLMQREARLFSASPLIPQHLRNGGPDQAMANCYIALRMARTMGEDPLVVLQNIHIVNGKAGFASQYMIARANASGVFKGRINWRIDKSDPKNLSVTAFGTLADDGEVVEFTADMAMAQAEGWTKNSKYRTMPEVMLRYRSAAFLIRFYAPDVMLGYHTSEEVEDMKFAQAIEVKPMTAQSLIAQATAAPVETEVEAEIVDTETGEITAEEAREGRSDHEHGDQFDGTDEAQDAAEPAKRDLSTAEGWCDQYVEDCSEAASLDELQGIQAKAANALAKLKKDKSPLHETAIKAGTDALARLTADPAGDGSDLFEGDK